MDMYADYKKPNLLDGSVSGSSTNPEPRAKDMGFEVTNISVLNKGENTLVGENTTLFNIDCRDSFDCGDFGWDGT